MVSRGRDESRIPVFPIIPFGSLALADGVSESTPKGTASLPDAAHGMLMDVNGKTL